MNIGHIIQKKSMLMFKCSRLSALPLGIAVYTRPSTCTCACTVYYVGVKSAKCLYKKYGISVLVEWLLDRSA